MIHAAGGETEGSAGRIPRILAMELETGGHHPGYLQNLTRYWVEHGLIGKLDFLVTPKFVTKHPDVAADITRAAAQGVQLIPITADEHRHLEQSPFRRWMRGWELFQTYARRLECDHAVVMYFDFFQMPSVLGTRPPCPFSCVYFRPTFHYHTFPNYDGSWKERFKAWRKRWVFSRVLRNPRLANVFCLDPFVTGYIEDQFRPDCRMVYFPDPVRIHGESLDVVEFRRELGIEPSRRVYLLLGGLDRRKGVLPLLAAIERLPSEVAAKFCLLMVGPVHPDQKQDVYDQIAKLRRTSSAQIVLKDEFVVDREVQRFYQAADVILATYQRHMGMSSALVRAGAAGKPVMSAAYGLMGELVRRRRLGDVVDTEDLGAIAAGIQRWIDVDLTTVFDAEEARRFAAENDANETGRVFFDTLLGPKTTPHPRRTSPDAPSSDGS